MFAALLVSFESRRVRPPMRGQQALPPRKRITSAVGVLVDGREAEDARGPAVRALADDRRLSVEPFARARTCCGRSGRRRSAIRWPR